MPPMREKFLKSIRGMELEDKVFHCGLLGTIVGICSPWISGGSYDGLSMWENGFGFRTGFIGHAVLLSCIFLFFVTFSPALGGPVIVKRSSRATVRFFVSGVMSILLVAAFTILARVTFEISGTDIRFGVYLAGMSSMLSTLYAFLADRDQRLRRVGEAFHHPDQPPAVLRPSYPPEADVEAMPPPPPPPPPPPLEHHPAFPHIS